MKGDITLNILEKIKDAAWGSVDFFEAMATIGYGASLSRMNYELSKKQSRRDNIRAENEREKELRRKFIRMLSKLEHDGLIEKRGAGKNSILKITPLGEGKLEALKFRKAKTARIEEYEKLPSQNLIIVTFDIPEASRGKRAWIRGILKNLNFTMVQQSVWMGKIKIPKIFLNDIKNMGLLDHIVIFEVSKSGNLEKII